MGLLQCRAGPPGGGTAPVISGPVSLEPAARLDGASPASSVPGGESVPGASGHQEMRGEVKTLCLYKGLFFIPFDLMPAVWMCGHHLSPPPQGGDHSVLLICLNPQAGVSLGDRDRLQKALQRNSVGMSCEFVAIDPAVGFVG